MHSFKGEKQIAFLRIRELIQITKKCIGAYKINCCRKYCPRNIIYSMHSMMRSRRMNNFLFSKNFISRREGKYIIEHLFPKSELK